VKYLHIYVAHTVLYLFADEMEVSSSFEIPFNTVLR
jgi:hypothetical protein